MHKNLFLSIGALVVATVVSLLAVYVYRDQIVMFNPQGWIALREIEVIATSTLLMLIVIIPVLVLSIYVTWCYRADNKKAKYDPDFEDNWIAELIWWGIPVLIIGVLAVITWETSHELDPYRPIASDKKPLEVQVVALRWKWLFIYPEYKVATVNYMPLPVDIPINISLSADAPMNSFWIPSLSGQIYAMPGMRSKLHLIANAVGKYRGSSSQLSGVGFSGMVFEADVMTEADFSQWIQVHQTGSQPLDLATYQQLAMPSSYLPVAIYTLQKDDLFDWIVRQPMLPKSNPPVDVTYVP